MPRIARGLADNQIYHIINRGNRREAVFHDNYDYEKFLKLIIESKEKYAIKIYAYCLMPNHFHLVIYTKYADSLSQAMHWISSSYVRYYNKRYNISGHLWQGRYKSFIVQEDSYLLVLLKYVEANPKRARIVKDCIDYKYSSANNRIKNNENLITDEVPILLPDDWYAYINSDEKITDIESIRNCINRQAPLGDKNWKYMVSKQYNLESTMNPRGRPKKEESS
jgi:putative transposase